MLRLLIGEVPGKYRNVLFCSDGPTAPVLMNAAEIVRKEFPQEAADGKIPSTEKLGKLQVEIDNRGMMIANRILRHHQT